MLDLAQARGITVIMSLFSFDLFQSGQTGVNITNSTNLITSDAGITAYINNSLIPMLAAVGNHPAVSCWEITNEPEGMSNEFGWTPSRVSMANIQKFTNRVAGAIHRNAPGAMVTTGAYSFQSLCNYFGGASKNYWSDAELLAAGGDADGYLDYYQVHYYDNWSAPNTSHSPFHHPATYWGLDKPIVVGEFRALGYTKDFTLTPTQCYNLLFDNGYAGAVSWTYTNHDGNGGLPDCVSAITDIYNKHPGDVTWNNMCNTTPTITPTWSVSQDPNLYNFEDGTIMGWSVVSDGITNPQNSTARFFLGSRSISVDAVFTSTIAGGTVGVSPPLVTDVTGQTIVARIWVPADIPQFSGAQIIIKSGTGWVWQQGIWTNLTPGIWNTVYFDTTHPDYTGAGTPDHTDVREISVKIAPPGAYAGTWSGVCYIDSVNVGLGAAPTPTPTATINISDPTLYPFETGTAMGWTIVADEITAAAYSTAVSFWGNGSLGVACNFTTTLGGNVGTQSPLVTNLQNKVIAARVFIPSDAPEYSGGYIYIKSGTGWVWQSAAWTTFERNTWNEIFFDTSNPDYTAAGTPNLADIKEIGVKVGPPGDFTGTWAGNIFIDSVDVWNTMPTPTVTITQTEAAVESPSSTPSFTATAVNTATQTAEPSPSFTATATVTMTQTTGESATNTPTITVTDTVDPANSPTNTLTVTNTFAITDTSTATATCTAVNTNTATQTSTTAPTFTITPTATEIIISGDPSWYPWEDGTTMGWTNFEDEVTASSWNPSRSYLGDGSMDVSYNFTTDAGGTVSTWTPLLSNLTGAVLTARVWVPLDFPANGGGYLFVKSGAGWTWANGEWVTFTPGSWNTVTMDISSPDFGTINAVMIQSIGVKISPETGWSGSASGTAAIDSLSISGIAATPTPGADTSTYPFEDTTTMTWDTAADEVTGSAWSGTYRYMGSGSLGVTCAFTSATGGTIGTQSPVVTDLRGATMTARVYMPFDMPQYSGAQIYIKSGAGWVWQSSAWTNLQPGKWTTLTYMVPSGTAGADLADVHEIGIKMAPPGTFSGVWNGSVYVDSVNILTASVSTPTNTVTATVTPTQTTAQSVTNTPTMTVTNTIDIVNSPTQTSTVTNTNTATQTSTTAPTFTITPTATEIIISGDPSWYPWEDGTTMGWTNFEDEVTASSWNPSRSYLGDGSMDVSYNFTTDAGGTVSTWTPLLSNLTGAVLTARVWVPLDFPANGGGYLFVKSGAGWTWANGEWVTFTPGSWNTVTMDISSPDFGTINAVMIQSIGVKISPETGWSGSASGTAAIDSLSISGIAATPTPGADTSTYPFEDTTTMTWDTAADEVTGSAWSGTYRYMGSGSLGVTCAFTSATGGTIGTQSPVVTDLRGATMTARVYMPFDMPQYSGAQIYIKSGAGWVWQSSAWTNLQPGKWTTLTYMVPSGTAGADLADVHEIGIKMAPPGSFAGSWNGSVYVDSVNILTALVNTPTATQTAGGPTLTWTPTRTPTLFVTATPTRTVTATQTMIPAAVPTKENQEISDIIPMPNPFNSAAVSQLRIDFTSARDYERAYVKLYSQSMRLVAHKAALGGTVGRNTFLIETGGIGNLSPGVYYLVVETKENGLKTRGKIEKIIILK